MTPRFLTDMVPPPEGFQPTRCQRADLMTGSVALLLRNPGDVPSLVASLGACLRGCLVTLEPGERFTPVGPALWHLRIPPDQLPVVHSALAVFLDVVEERAQLCRRVAEQDLTLQRFQQDLVATREDYLHTMNAVAHRVRETTTLNDRLASSEARLRAIYEGSHDGILLLHEGGTFFDCNRRALEMFGLERREDVVGRGLEDLTAPCQPDWANAAACVHTALSSGCCRQERVFRRADGQEFPAEVVLSAFDYGGERVLQATVRDISDRRRAEAERAAALLREQEARRAAEAANRSKDEFLAILSHELRTPLTPIVCWAAMLRSGRAAPGAVARGLEVIERSAQAQARLVEDLLDVSHMVTGKPLVSRRAVDLVPLLDVALEGCQPLADAKQVRLVRRVEVSSAPLLGDPGRLRQVVVNLVGNAIKFTPGGGQVEVALRRQEGHLLLQVSDTGEGIAPEQLPRVFDRFWQADSSATRRFGGLGLGLAIVRHLVEAHGGTVRGTSPGKGQGATFTVTLPESLGAVVEGVNGQAHPGRDPLLELAGLRVLVVEDEPDTRDMLARILELHGAVAAQVATAAQALEVWEQFRPAVLLSDIGLPNEDGCALIGKVRARPVEQGGTVPAIALSAYAREQDQRRVLAAGFQRFLAKPVAADTLVAAVAQLAAGPAPC